MTALPVRAALAVARIFLREAWERKLLLLAVPFLVALGFGLALPVTDAADRPMLLRDVGLQGGVVLAVLACIAVAAVHPGRARARGELSLIAAGPAPRASWVAGQALGLAALACMLVGAAFLATALLCGALFGVDSLRMAQPLAPLEQRALGETRVHDGDTWYLHGVEARFRLPSDLRGALRGELRARLSTREDRLVLAVPVRIAWSFGQAAQPGAEGSVQLSIRDDLPEPFQLSGPPGAEGWVRVELLAEDVAMAMAPGEVAWSAEPQGLRLWAPRSPVLRPWSAAAALGVLEVLLGAWAALAASARWSTPVALLAGAALYLGGLLHSDIREFLVGAGAEGEVIPAHVHESATATLQVPAWSDHVLGLLDSVLPSHQDLDGAGVLGAGAWVPWSAVASGLRDYLPYLLLFLLLGILLFGRKDLE